MFGSLLANGFATWRDAIAQSGCLPVGSLLTNQEHQSAIRHRLVGSLSYGNLRAPAIHGFAINHYQARSRGFAATVRRSNSAIRISQSSRPSHPMCAATALSPGSVKQCQGFDWQSLLAACPSAVRAAMTPINWLQNTANHSVKGSTAMQRPKSKMQIQALVFSTPSTARTCLTVSSSGTIMLRIIAPQLWR